MIRRTFKAMSRSTPGGQRRMNSSSVMSGQYAALLRAGQENERDWRRRYPDEAQAQP
jgi:hypothetical protein